jgi:hypothetical protein
MRRELRFWRVLLAASAVAWLLARGIGAPALQAIAGVALVDLLPGIAVLRLLGLHRRSRLWVLLAAGALSLPVFAAATGLLSWVTGLSPDALALHVLLLWAVVLAWPGGAPRTARVAPAEGAAAPPVEAVDPEEARPAPENAAAVFLGALLAGVVALGLLNPRLAQWSDAWFHAAVFHEVVRVGVPPGFPHFAGQGLPYPWFFHLALASCRRVVSGDPFLLMALLNIWTALLWAAGIHLLARACGLPARTARWSVLAGVLGVNPLGGLLLVGRSLVGETRGLETIRLGLADANAGVCSLAFIFPPFQSGLLSRLWTPTAFNFALVLAALAVMAWLEAWDRPRPRVLLLFLLVLTLLFYWHTLTALDLVSGIAMGVVVGVVVRARSGLGSGLARAVAIGAVAFVAWLLVRPYLDNVMLGVTSGRMMTPHFLGTNAAGLVLSMGPVALAALFGVPALAPGRRGPLLGLALGLLIAFLFFDLPFGTEEKLYYPLFVLLAAWSGAGWVRIWAWGRAARVVVLLAILVGLVTSGFTVSAFLGDRRPIRDLFDSVHPERAALFTPDEAAALDWLREQTPPDAVLLQHRRPNGPEPIMVYGRRRLFLGYAEAFYRAVFFPRVDQPPAPPEAWRELLRRQALQAAVFSDRVLPADTLAMLRSYPWPLYLWWDRDLGGGRLSPTLHPGALAREVFTSASVRLLQVFPDSAQARLPVSAR